MRPFPVCSGTALLVTALGAAACGGARTGPETTPAAASTADLEALYRARLDSARMQFTPADAHFMTGMISHHAQALVMAGLAPTHGASPPVRTLCARIINAQRDEIARLQQLLRERGQPVPEVHLSGTDLTVHGAGHDGPMPGMLSPDQMHQLDQARGPAFDQLFLTFMIHHHKGAVTMVHELFGTDGAARDGAVFKLASDIQVDQLTEIARMERMLETASAAGGQP